MGGGTHNRVFRKFWGQRSSRGHCSNMLKTLLRLHYSIDFDETWVRDPWPEVLSGCSGIFDRRSSWGHLGSLLKGQPSTTKLTMSMCWFRSTIKKVHGDLFIQPVVKGSMVRKIQIWFYVGSNVELLYT